MILSFANIIQYTINQLSWITESRNNVDDFFVEGDYSIIKNPGLKNLGDGNMDNFSLRNISFLIQTSNEDNSNGYFLKQPKIFNQNAINSLIREATFYEKIKEIPQVSDMSPLFFDYNIGDAILILEGIKNSTDLKLLRENPKITDAEISTLHKQVGQQLRLFHDSIKNHKATFESYAPLFFENNVPLLILELDLDILDFQYRYQTKLRPFIKILRDKFNDGIPMIKEGLQLWKEAEKTIIHGDFKSGNILVKKENTQREVYFIDWEFAVWGVPAFDISTFYYYLLVIENFNIEDENIAKKIKGYMKDLVEGYYGSKTINDAQKNQIIVFLKLRLIEYFITEYEKDVELADFNDNVEKFKSIMNMLLDDSLIKL